MKCARALLPLMAAFLFLCGGTARGEEPKPPAPEIARLVEKFESPDPEVQQKARDEIMAMNRDGVPVVAGLLRSKSAEARRAALEFVEALGPDAAGAVEAAIPLLGAATIDERRRASTSLAAVGLPAVPLLLKTLKEGVPFAREEAANALGWTRIADEGILAGLKAAAGDPEDAVSAAAIDALGAIGGESVPVLAALLDHGSPRVRSLSAAALGGLFVDGRPAVPALAKRLADAELEVRKSAARALANFGADAAPALPALVESLKDPDAELRQLAALAIGEIGPAAAPAVGALAALLKDGDEQARLRAVFALGRIGKDASASVPALVDLLGNNAFPFREFVLDALESIADTDERVQDSVRKAARDPEPMLRLRAAKWLVKRLTGTGKDVSVLLDLLANRDPMVRLEAVGPVVRAFKEGLVDEAVVARIRDDPDSRVRERARAVLAAAGIGQGGEGAGGGGDTGDRTAVKRRKEVVALAGKGAEAVPELARALSDLDFDVRIRAARLLARMGPVAEAAVPALVRALDETCSVWGADAALRDAGLSEEADRELLGYPRGFNLVAADALVRIGKAAVPALEAAWKGGPLGTRFGAACALGRMGLAVEMDEPTLLQAIGSASARDRQLALDYLAERGTARPEILKVLVDVLGGNTYEDSRGAEQALRRSGGAAVPFLIEGLRAGPARLRESVANLLARFPGAADAAVPVLAGLLADPDPGVRAAALDALAAASRVPGEAVPGLVGFLEDGDASRRSKAIGLLARIEKPSPEVVAAVGKRLSDENLEVRLEAAQLLMRVEPGNRAALKALLGALGAENRWLRDRLAHALAAAGKDAVPLLVEQAKNGPPGAREGAIEILGWMREEAKDAVGALVELLKDEKEDIRLAAVRSLGRLRSDAESALPALAALRKEASGALLEEVKEAISSIRDMVDVDVPEGSDPKVAEVVLRALKHDIEQRMRESIADFQYPVGRRLFLLGAPAVPILARALELPGVGGIAALGLGCIEDPSAVEPLAACLDRGKGSYDHELVHALAMSRDPRAVGPLLRLLESMLKEPPKGEPDDLPSDRLPPHLRGIFDRSGRREQAEIVTVFGRLDSAEATAALLRLAGHEAPHVREAAVRALGGTPGADVGAVLRERLGKDADASVRLAAAVSLLRRKEEVEAAGAEIVKAASEEGSGLRLEALQATFSLEVPGAEDLLVGALKDPDEYVVDLAARALGAMKSRKAVEPLIATLGREREGVHLSWGPLVALARIGDERALPALAKALREEAKKNDFYEKCGSAALGLAFFRAKAVDPLLELLKDRNPLVRKWAAWALLQTGEPRAREPLLQALLKDLKSIPDEELDLQSLSAPSGVEGGIHIRRDENRKYLLEKHQSSAAESLGRLGERIAAPALAAAAKDGPTGVRRASVLAMGRIGDPSSLGALVAAATDADEWVRAAAMAALGAFPESAAVEALIRGLSDKEDGVRSAAVASLRKIGDPKAVGPLLEVCTRSPGTEIGLEAALALAKLSPGESSRNLVRGYFDHADWELRASAARRAWETADRELVPELRKRFEEGEFHAVRVGAAVSLVRLERDEAALEFLLWQLDRSWLPGCLYGVEALGEAGDARAALRIVPFLRYGNDMHCMMQAGAIAALGKVGGEDVLPFLDESTADTPWTLEELREAAQEIRRRAAERKK